MRTYKRNQKEFTYRTNPQMTEIMDGDNHTGEYSLSYTTGTGRGIFGRVTGFSAGNTYEQEATGIFTGYQRSLITDTDLNEGDFVIFEGHAYGVYKKSALLTHTEYKLYEVRKTEAE